MNTDWTPQEDWSTVKVGDQVRVTCDEGMLTGKVRYVVIGVIGDFHSIIIDVPSLPDSVVVHRSEWSLSVPAKPAVELPTEPGIYVESGRKPNTVDLWTLHENGRWVSNAGSKYDSRVEEFAPFTKLEPVAVTAKKVLDRFAAYWEDGMPADMSIEMRGIAKEFGVSHD